MNKLILYTRPECHLCDVMKEDILSLKNELEFTLEEVNIEKDSDLLEKYKEKIPVLTLNGRIIAKYSVDRKKLMNILF